MPLSSPPPVRAPPPTLSRAAAKEADPIGGQELVIAMDFVDDHSEDEDAGWSEEMSEEAYQEATDEMGAAAKADELSSALVGLGAIVVRGVSVYVCVKPNSTVLKLTDSRNPIFRENYFIIPL